MRIMIKGGVWKNTEDEIDPQGGGYEIWEDRSQAAIMLPRGGATFGLGWAVAQVKPSSQAQYLVLMLACRLIYLGIIKEDCRLRGLSAARFSLMSSSSNPTVMKMQDFIGSVRRSLVFKPSRDDDSSFGGFVEKIGSNI